jgi:hypothetical protein
MIGHGVERHGYSAGHSYIYLVLREFQNLPVFIAFEPHMEKAKEK